MYHRPPPTVRQQASLASTPARSPTPSPRLSPVIPPASHSYSEKSFNTLPNPDPASPSICGLPLKYVSLVTLAVQNAALSIVMHYSRVSTPPELAYSPASAVLLNELFKGSISFFMALFRTYSSSSNPDFPRHHRVSPLTRFFSALSTVLVEIFSPDCWKLSIPAILYVVQNSLQFVAISNLPVATFQVTYQMKILTTAAFSVALLRRRLSTTKWLSLFFLAIGVGIVQIQTSFGSHGGSSVSSAMKDIPVGSAHDFSAHVMHPLKGFGAVTAACFTSGLAGVYFEMVLKNSKADLWVRNVQLSLFSLIPALLPILYAPPVPHSQGFVSDLLRNFGFWAWATVGIQVFGGLVTALVIKYSDNILKGFATSLSIVLSFLASVALFDFHITWSFVLGATTVLTATWMYNQPPGKEPIAIVLTGAAVDEKDVHVVGNGFPGSEKSPVDSPILGTANAMKRKQAKVSPFPSPRIIANALGMATTASTNLHPGILEDTEQVGGYFGEMLDTTRYNSAPYGSPWNSRAPSRVPSRPATPSPTATSPTLSPTTVSYLNSNLKEMEGGHTYPSGEER